LYHFYGENRTVSIFIHSVSKSFKYLTFQCNYSVDRTHIIKPQERLICLILICPQKLTVLVNRFTLWFRLWASANIYILTPWRMTLCHKGYTWHNCATIYVSIPISWTCFGFLFPSSLLFPFLFFLGYFFINYITAVIDGRSYAVRDFLVLLSFHSNGRTFDSQNPMYS